jgi:hypothetical protein
MTIWEIKMIRPNVILLSLTKMIIKKPYLGQTTKFEKIAAQKKFPADCAAL